MGPRRDERGETRPLPPAGLSSTRQAVDGSTRSTTDRVVAGRYRLSSLLGAGATGEVWLAEDAVLGRAVALKQLTNRRGATRPAALREARAAASVTHPGVVAVHDVVVDDDEDWIVMEALAGEPLSATIGNRGRLGVDEVRQIGLHLLSALEAIHAAGLVHRDVKPGNVQLCGDRVVVIDFGLSAPGGARGGLRVGKLEGSLPYLAPEALLDGVFGPASDLYALGVTLYAAVEGGPPFDSADEPMELLESVLFDQPEPATHAGPLRAVLEGLLEKDPALRLDLTAARACLQAATSAAWA
jgi:eukaryotic-like serine/threonine-protein kinase